MSALSNWHAGFQLAHHTNHMSSAAAHSRQPTVGEACEKYHVLPLKTRGLHISLADRGAILAKLKSWPVQNVRVIVVTDGERILGLGECQQLLGWLLGNVPVLQPLL